MKTFVVMNHYILNDELNKMALEAIKSFRDTSDVFIVNVDDCSPFDTSEIKAASDHFIRLETNQGFAKSANAGFRYVLDNFKDCYIIYANNDIMVEGVWFGIFKRLIDEGSDMVGGLGYKNKGFPPDVDSRKMSIGGRFNDWMFPGGFYMTTDRFFREIGIYDEGYIHGSIEDIDLFWRAKQANKELMMTAGVKYWHKEGATRYSTSLKEYNKQMELLNIKYFENKHGFNPIKFLTNKILIDNPINP